ncbi:unnamed protein product [Adineta steineri]|uniref:PNPLA domain-containing protein n=1 Tax=Adineta steineri TaxID=433720 RepID=A0A815GXG5_9BILA|nr:unnamed protein product [Adineta steineri]CAF1344028.1 unnamed protein product [Adineta steineri]
MDDDDVQIGIQEVPPIRTIDTNFDIPNIRKIKFPDGSLISCEHAIRIDNNNRTQSEVLDTLLSGALQTRGHSLMEDQFFNLNDIELEAMSKKYKIAFQRCTIELDSTTDNYVFSAVYHYQTLPVVYVIDYGREVIALCISSNSYLYNLYRELNNNRNNTAILHFKLACYYEQRAEENDYNLALWQNACYHYAQVLNYKRNTGLIYSATIGNCKCLVQLGKYGCARKKLAKLYHLYGSAQHWLLLAKIQRRTGQNDKAIETIKKCFIYEDNDRKVLMEQKLIKQKDTREQTLSNNALNDREGLTRKTYNELVYNILSIDGGGFRGLIPAIWLAAIERKTKHHCSSMFQMLAGTSTGAIIACGLSMPSALKIEETHYRATDIVELYKNHANEIFIPATRRRLLYRWCTQSSRYSRSGRENLFNRYFKGVLLSNCITDIVVPAVVADRTRTQLFTRYDARLGNIRPPYLVDVLMSTTAAPTYFRPHAYDYSAYIDGGVQMNNPTMAAYSEALRYGYHNKNIFVLSLGTGDYIHNPLQWPTANRNCYFWLRNRKIILKNLFDIAQNNIDYQMSMILNENNYHRWQIWFEDEILLDDYGPETIEILEDYAYTFLEELEGRDDNKRLGVVLDRLD